MPVKKSSASDVFQRKISDFCDLRLAPLLQPRSFENLKGFMIGLVVFQSRPPLRAGRVDWQEIGTLCGIDKEVSAELKRTAQPGFDAILRWLRATQPATASVQPVAPKSPLRVVGKTGTVTRTERRPLIQPARARPTASDSKKNLHDRMGSVFVGKSSKVETPMRSKS